MSQTNERNKGKEKEKKKKKKKIINAPFEMERHTSTGSFSDGFFRSKDKNSNVYKVDGSKAKLRGPKKDH